MKKFVVVIFIFLVIFSCVKDQTHFSLLEYFAGEYTVYTSSGQTENAVDLGFCYMNNKPTNQNVVGESMVVSDLEIGSALSSLKARVVKTEYLEDGTTVIYAHTNLIREQVKVDGKNVNLQIANKGDRFVIGWPLILGSY